VNTSVHVGGSIGLAVLATLSAQRTDHLTVGGGDPTEAALNSGYHLAYLIGAGLVGVAILIGIFVLENKLPAMMTGESPAEEEEHASAEAALSEAA
jgi:hypothetical protein